MGGGLCSPPLFFMRVLIILICSSIVCYGVDFSEITASGLYDSTDGRIYLRDIRQILGWIVGLHLVHLTIQAFRPM